MIFTVMWRQQAIEELARVWMATADRQRLSDAVSRIDAGYTDKLKTCRHGGEGKSFGCWQRR